MSSVLPVAIAAVLAAVVAAQGAPPLPYESFTTWAVVTNILVTGSGPNTTSKTLWSVGQVLNADSPSNVLCATRQQQLPPVVEYTTTEVVNYTAGWRKSRQVMPSGDARDCQTAAVQKQTLPPGGGWLLAPSPAIRQAMRFLNYTVIGKLNCSIYQHQLTPAADTLEILTWTLSTAGSVPQVYVNETVFIGQKRSAVLTTAYNGYHQLVGQLPWECLAVDECGTGFCAARPDATAAALTAALSWVCGAESCSSINPGGARFYPNSLVAHATVAFNEYYQADRVAASCVFGGAAVLVLCPTVCSKCGPKPSATEAELLGALTFLCSPQGVQDCSPIRPGGAHFLPNTTRAHAAWGMDLYYQAYKCVPGWDACDFAGVAAVLPCS